MRYSRWCRPVIHRAWVSLVTYFGSRWRWMASRCCVSYVSLLMSSIRQLELTAEQLAKSQSRKALKLSKNTQQPQTPPVLRPRQWLSIPAADHNVNSPSHRVKVLSWNVRPNTIYPLFHIYGKNWTSRTYSFLHNAWFVRNHVQRHLILGANLDSQEESFSRPVPVSKPSRENRWYTKRSRGKMQISSASRYISLRLKFLPVFLTSFFFPLGSW